MFTLGNSSKYLYLSSNGADDFSCTFSAPCKSLSHVVAISSKFDTIYVHGGAVKPAVYVFNQSVVLNKSIVIKRSQHSGYNPQFTSSDIKKPMHLFQVTNTSACIDVESIDIINLNLVRYSFNTTPQKPINISLKHLEIKSTKALSALSFRSFIHEYSDLSLSINILILSSKINYHGRIIFLQRITQKNITILVSKTSITSGMFEVERSPKGKSTRDMSFLNVTFVNGTMTSKNKSALVVNCDRSDNYLSTVHISHFDFIQNMIALNLRSISSVRISKCNFMGNVLNDLILTDILSVVTTDTKFVGTWPHLVANRCLLYKIKGGAIYSENSNLHILRCDFNQNKAEIGGAIYAAKTNITLVESTIRNNCAMNAAGINVFKSDIQIDSCKISHNYAQVRGGAVLVSQSKLKMTNTKIEKNFAKKNGGGIHILKCMTVEVIECYFKRNTVSINGGAMNIERSNALILSSVFNRNVAKADGAALHISNSKKVTISESKMYRNRAYETGGGIRVIRSNVNITKTVITNNTAKQFGGGINVLSNSNVTISGVKLKWNAANRAGGAIHIKKSYFNVSATTINENYGKIGGGIVSEASSLGIYNTDLIKNRATHSPSAIYYNVIEGGALKLEMKDIYIVASGSLPVADAIWITAGDQRRASVFMDKVQIFLKRSSFGVPAIFLSLSGIANLNFSYTCPPTYNAIYTKVQRTFQLSDNYVYTFRCQACRSGTYTLGTGFQQTTIHPLRSITQYNKSLECYTCPSGGNCRKELKSRENFWGYVDKERAKFLPCPEGYCCSESQNTCRSLSSCGKHRTGKLCGQCAKGYHVNYFSDKCEPNNNRSLKSLFWFIFIALAMTYSVLLAYMKEIGFYFKYFTNYCISHCCQRKKEINVWEAMPLVHLSSTPEITNQEYCFEKDDFVVVYGSPPVKEVEKAETSYIQEKSRNAGIFKVLVGFYQIKALLTVRVSEDAKQHSNSGNFLTSVFNLDIPKEIVEMCPLQSVDAVSKHVIKDLLLPMCMLFLVMLPIFLATVCLTYAPRKYRWPCRRLLLRGSLCSMQVILISYTILAKFSMQLIHCRQVGEDLILYINGEITCHTYWQKAILAFFFLWVVPFPLALYKAVRLLERNKITIKSFFFLLLLPIFGLISNCLPKRKETKLTSSIISQYICRMFEEPFRSRVKHNEKTSVLFWDTWRLYQRLIIAAFAIFFIDPIQRLSFLLPIMLLLVVVHLRVKPYKHDLVNWLETASLVSLCFLTGSNLFRGFLYVYSMHEQENLLLALRVLNAMEFVCTPFVGFVIYISLKFAAAFFHSMYKCKKKMEFVLVEFVSRMV